LIKFLWDSICVKGGVSFFTLLGWDVQVGATVICDSIHGVHL